MNGKVYVVLAFVIGLAFGLSFSLTIRPAPNNWYKEWDVKATVGAAQKEMGCVYWDGQGECISTGTPVPTATPHVCPPLPEPCSTVLYKDLPDVTGVLSTLGLVDYEMALLDTKLENYITSTEGEYDWNLVGILALHRSTHNSLLEADDEITYWFNLGQLTCQSEALEICANYSTCRGCMGTFISEAPENEKARHCVNQMMIGR